MEFVVYRVRDHVAHLVMSRPPVNALSIELVRDILEGYRLAKMEQSDAMEGLDAFAEKRDPVWQADRTDHARS